MHRIPIYGQKSPVLVNFAMTKLTAPLWTPSADKPYAPYNSLTERIQAISDYIDQASEKDLCNFFVDLVYEIFGRGPTKGWTLDKLNMSKFSLYRFGDPDNVYKFLCVNGHIFKLCYKLLPNSSIKFNLSFSDIPVGLRQKIENSFGHSYYTSRFLYRTDSNIPIGLSLNTFEYYIFHFVLYGLKLEDNDCLFLNNNLKETTTVYRLLCSDYLHFFLPLDGSASTILPKLHFNVLSVNTKHKHFISPRKSSSFIKKEISCTDNNDKIECSWLMKSEATWRSELVAFFFIDIWLSCHHISLVPSVELNKLIRFLIKHFHLYTNRAKQQPSDSLKLILIARHGANVYHYLSYYMVNWPQDFSFRVLLEIWLCYIQPWRYELIDNRQISITENEMNNKWRVFIIRNLLSYTKLFYLTIKRFNCVNICTPRYSFMIFRLLKVFTHPYLLKMLLNIEHILIQPYQQNSNLNALLCDYLIECEGPFYKYEPMFSEGRTFEYKLFYSKLQNTLELTMAKLHYFQENKMGSPSMVEMIFSQRKPKISDYSVTEWEEIQTNIQSALIFMKQIISVNNVPISMEPDSPINWSLSNLNNSFNNSRGFCHNDLPILSFDRSSSFLFSNQSYKKQWEIDPDYLGTLSYENDSLVKLSTQLRNLVECYLKPQILKYSSENTLLASVIRQVLIRPPLMIFSYEPRNDGSGKRVRTPKVVQPTISFRWAASYYNLIWILILLALMLVSNNIRLCITLFYGFRVIYLCLKYFFGYAPPFTWDDSHEN